MKCNCTIENLINGNARLIIYINPADNSEKVVRDFPCLEDLDKYLEEYIRGDSFDVVI